MLDLVVGYMLQAIFTSKRKDTRTNGVFDAASLELYGIIISPYISVPPCLSPQSPHRRSSPPPQAGPAGRTARAQSGRSWTSGGWRAAASRSAPGPGRPRCGHAGREGSVVNRQTSNATGDLDMGLNTFH